MSRMTGSALLVGSVPLESVEEVFATSARELGRFLSAYPDGELGERADWILNLPRKIYSQHPDLVQVYGPEGGKFVQPPPGASDEENVRSQQWTFRLRDGVDRLEFSNMHYAEPATASYKIFVRMRDAGEIPADARFQVTLPATGSGVMQFFEDPQQWPVVNEAYQRGMRAELQRLVEAVPAEDLVIQWDLAHEVRDLLAEDEPLFPWSPKETLAQKWERHVADFAELSYELPEQALLGYHFCFGTWGGWPHSPAPDMEVCVRLANAAVSNTGRTVDYVHMPVMPNPGDGFFDPMSELEIGDCKVYLGVVLHDDVEAFERRVTSAMQYLSGFGVGSYCGWGREDSDTAREMMAHMRVCAERLAIIEERG
jgi:hypothetical protein